ncbi:dendritic arbor reduction protein 1-like [Scylla paramamosain]|uniref:dendritic arbor reduction protein 1-like n=1 Tax=Scylla paramamosain TaxID=85552 RepID=UPI0030831E08
MDPTPNTQQRRKRKPNWSSDETLRLVNIMAEKRCIIKGRFQPSLTHADKKRAWEDITNSVNACNLHVKRTKEEVVHKWFTMLSHLRRKIGNINKEQNQSGAGGPKATPLDPIDLKVQEMIGEKSVTTGGISPVKGTLLRKLRANRAHDQQQVTHQRQQQQHQEDHQQQQHQEDHQQQHQLDHQQDHQQYPHQEDNQQHQLLEVHQQQEEVLVIPSPQLVADDSSNVQMNYLDLAAANAKSVYRDEKRRLKLLKEKAKIEYWQERAKYYKNKRT